MAILSTEKAHYKLQLHKKVEMHILIYINFQVSFRVMQTWKGLEIKHFQLTKYRIFLDLDPNIIFISLAGV